MITVTEAAARQLREILTGKENHAIRLYLKGAG